MRRVLGIAAVLLAAGALTVFATGAGGGSGGGGKYWAELDNAFGLITGGDLKIAGVRAGKITDLKLNRSNNRALVGFNVTQSGFGSLRKDAFCQSRPQSLIGEYYLDCAPGTSSQTLAKGSTIPVTQTASTIAPDLVGDILRQPYRQRFSIILGELGAGVGGNGQNLSQALRRAVPALRNTNQVLEILAQQNRTLQDLATQGDTVLNDLSNNRKDVQRFVVTAKGAAQDTAAKKQELAQGFAKLPGFLEQLRPAMAALGQVADQNTPALRDLNASSTQLRTLFTNLAPFARASTPAFKALGQASVTGDQAVQAANPMVAQLNQFAAGSPELGKNLSIVLQHLDNPQYAIETDHRAAAQHVDGRANYTGLESLLQYVYDETLATNEYDQNGHLLGLSLFVDPSCSPYADAAGARNPANARCRSYLGPTQPGVNAPDPTAAATPANARAKAPKGKAAPVAQAPAAAPQQAQAPAPAAPAPGQQPAQQPQKTCIVGICLPPVQLPGLPPINAGSLTNQVSKTVGAVTGQRQSGQSQQAQNSLLNYLLKP